ncbi:unnamed protein product [Ilex paraguariensis]|uniref:Pentatricopeptide repeat-containing protein n=1 Tax=Ilex paraguariensis TaxID=185542 RepID=A0ABC8TZ99_9AQUA
MGKHRKLSLREDSSSSSSSKVDPYKKPYSSSASHHARNSAPHHQKHQDLQQQQQIGKRPTFPSYLETPNLPPKMKLLCEIIANTPSLGVETVLEDTGIRVSREDVEEVLKLSYGFPGPAVKFFRWSGHQLNDKHSPYAWNLVVDLLGKNSLFDAMWDAIKSMKKEGLLSLATFASVFSSYVEANQIQEAIMTFEVMDQYGCPRDIVALNSLLSAICSHGNTRHAKEFLGIAKDKIRLDADTYAILLEGWANEGNVDSARQTFTEMVADIGWDPRNVLAYDTVLTTFLKGPDGMHSVMKFFDTMRDRRCYPGMKFFKAALEECLKKVDVKTAQLLWDEMIGKNCCSPDTEMYNSMIALHCYVKDTSLAISLLDEMDTSLAISLLDEMVYNGAFPDVQTYNILFQFLIKIRRLKDASTMFSEMIKNECVPSHANCSSAVKMYMDGGDPYMAIKVWKCMIENFHSQLEDISNFLVVELREINKVPEAVKCAEDMIDRGIKLSSSSLSKLKQSLTKSGKAFVYDELLRKWKTH